MFFIYSPRSSILYKNYKTQNVIKWSENNLLVCRLIEFQNNYLREYNTQLSLFVFYLNRCMPASFSESFIAKFLLLNKMLNLQNVSEERKMPSIHGWICTVVSSFRFHIPHQLSNKTTTFFTLKTEIEYLQLQAVL